jgi:hypothetical protein
MKLAVRNVWKPCLLEGPLIRTQLLLVNDETFFDEWPSACQWSWAMDFWKALRHFTEGKRESPLSHLRFGIIRRSEIGASEESPKLTELTLEELRIIVAAYLNRVGLRV